MNLEQIAQVFKDARAIWAGLLGLLAVAAWAGDQRWMPKEDSERMVSVIEIRQRSQRIDELEIQKTYEDDPRRVQMLDAMININRNKIQTIIHENQLAGE